MAKLLLILLLVGAVADELASANDQPPLLIDAGPAAAKA